MMIMIIKIIKILRYGALVAHRKRLIIDYIAMYPVRAGMVTSAEQ